MVSLGTIVRWLSATRLSIAVLFVCFSHPLAKVADWLAGEVVVAGSTRGELATIAEVITARQQSTLAPSLLALKSSRVDVSTIAVPLTSVDRRRAAPPLRRPRTIVKTTADMASFRPRVRLQRVKRPMDVRHTSTTTDCWKRERSIIRPGAERGERRRSYQSRKPRHHISIAAGQSAAHP